MNASSHTPLAPVTYQEHTLASHDGTVLFMRHWIPTHNHAQHHVFVVHGYMEHSGRYREYAHAMAQQNIAVHALDLRGHGNSEGARGYVRMFSEYLDDVQCAFKTLPHPESCVLLGHSMGGLIALDAVAQGAVAPKGLVVVNPYLGLTQPAPLLKTLLAHAANRLLPKLSLNAGLNPYHISHDTDIVAAYARDPKVFSTANASWHIQTMHAQERVKALKQVNVPLLYIYSDADPIASPALNQTLAQQLQSPHKTVCVKKGELHEVLNEVGRVETYQTVAQWVRLLETA
jgi:alpha-beta hydrolase superfamily lysophospholipase